MNARNHARLCGIAAALALSILPQAHVPQAKGQQPDQSQVAPLTKAYNASGLELFQTLTAEPGNIVLSPYSIGTAMAMVLSGVRAETEEDMRKALRHALAGKDIDAANARALATLNAYNQPAAPKCPDGFALKDKLCEAAAPKNKDEDCPHAAKRDGQRCVIDAGAASAKLRIANALMLVNAAATIAPEFKATIQSQYGSDVFAGADLEKVNNWVSEKTEGKIPVILEKLSPNDSHVLLNAVYFNAPWAHAFAKNVTRDREFSLSANEEVNVPTMSQQAAFAVHKSESFSAIRLPYAVDGLSMTVLRPDEVDGLAAVIKEIGGDKLAAVIDEVRKAPKRTVALSMPRFKFEFKADLIAPFKSLGMTKVFDAGQSDLSGMTGLSRDKAQSSIDQIVHRAVIEVAEEGTEAAAATAVVITTRTMSVGGPEQFQIDRPFMFVISDDKTGAVLFEGRVSDPRK